MAVVIRFHDGLAIASYLKEKDAVDRMTDENFSLFPEYFGDYDYICDENGRRIGISYLTSNEEFLASTLFSKSQNVEWEGSMVLFFFAPLNEWKIESAQEIGTMVYESESKEIALLLPECLLDSSVLK